MYTLRVRERLRSDLTFPRSEQEKSTVERGQEETLGVGQQGLSRSPVLF